MSTLACTLLRHDVRPRWIGDLLAQWCHTCGCLFIPEPASPGRPVSPHGSARSGALPIPVEAQPPPLA